MDKTDQRRRPNATVHDVARQAGVSSMTVSRVVNGERYVSAKMRAKVEAALQALDYRPNLAARAARVGELRIGLLYSNPSAAYLSELLLGALEQSRHTGAQLVLENSLPDEAEGAAVQRLLDDGIDGVMLPPPLCDSPTAIAALLAARIQVLALATAAPRADVSAVRIDDYAGALTMTRHLIAQGHRDIAFIKGDPNHTPAVLRFEAFMQAMDEAGLEPPPHRIAEGDFTYQSGLLAGERILSAGSPTAIFASNDDMAAAVIAVAHGRNLSIPDQISICGFDDTPMATTIWPALTTVRQPIRQMAKVALEQLAGQIRQARSGEPPTVAHHTVDFTLVARQSSGPAHA